MMLPGLLLSLALLARPLPYHPTMPARPAAPPTDSTTARLLYGVENADLNQLLSQELHIEKHRLQLHDRRLAGRRLHLTCQEYRHGVAGPEKPLHANANLTQLDSAGRLSLTIYARATSGDQVENRFLLPRTAFPRTFAAEPGQADHYSLRFDLRPHRRAANQAGAPATTPAEELRLPIGPTFVLAVYTLPYEQDGMQYYCSLAQSQVPVTEWFARYRVPHFVVYRARFE